MCLECVENGRMTAEEYAERRAAGDKTMVPMLELEPGDFRDSLAHFVALLVENGTPREEAVQVGQDVGRVYDLLSDVPADQRLALLREALG